MANTIYRNHKALYQAHDSSLRECMAQKILLDGAIEKLGVFEDESAMDQKFRQHVQ